MLLEGFYELEAGVLATSRGFTTFFQGDAIQVGRMATKIDEDANLRRIIQGAIKIGNKCLELMKVLDFQIKFVEG